MTAALLRESSIVVRLLVSSTVRRRGDVKTRRRGEDIVLRRRESVYVRRRDDDEKERLRLESRLGSENAAPAETDDKNLLPGSSASGFSGSASGRLLFSNRLP